MNNRFPMAALACRHGQDRGGKACGYAASLGQRKCVAHIPTADAKAAVESCLKDKGRRDHTFTSAIHGPRLGDPLPLARLMFALLSALTNLATILQVPEYPRHPDRYGLNIRQLWYDRALMTGGASSLRNWDLS
jgi:hypothetical protein